MNRTYCGVIAVAAVVLLPSIGCQSASTYPPRAPEPTLAQGTEWTTLLCSPSVPGAVVSAQPTPRGVRVVIRAPGKDVTDLRSAALQHSIPVPVLRGRGVPAGVDKLPGDTRIRTDVIPDGIAVTYTGTNADGCSKVRQVVKDAVGRMGSGQCVMLVASARNVSATPSGVDDHIFEGDALACD